jgi:hypothetical protein
LPEIVERSDSVVGGLGGRGAEGGDGHEAVDAEIFFGEGELDEAGTVGEVGTML